MQTLFLDESGDHSLTVIDPQYPVFVLGGVILNDDYERGEASARLERFKRDLFGSHDFVLHTADIVRQVGPFSILSDSCIRSTFRHRLNALMRELEFTVVACAIRKDAHLAAYGTSALDPYILSLNVLIERFCFALHDLGETEPGVVIAERRDPALDAALLAAWRHIRARGTSYLRPATIRERIARLDLQGKSPGRIGLELADLVVSPIGRYVAEKPPREDWAIVEAKLRRRGGSYWGSGLVVLPKG